MQAIPIIADSHDALFGAHLNSLLSQFTGFFVPSHL